MDFTRLDYIKNVNDGDGKWAYCSYPLAADFPLNFKEGKGVDTHALNLTKGSFIILSQRPPDKERYLTHIVELVNEGSEDQPQWEPVQWGIFRWVKVHWVADFQDLSRIPLDQNVMRADWGRFDTKAKSLNSPSLMSQWGNIENLKTHLKQVFS